MVKPGVSIKKELLLFSSLLASGVKVFLLTLETDLLLCIHFSIYL